MGAGAGTPDQIEQFSARAYDKEFYRLYTSSTEEATRPHRALASSIFTSLRDVPRMSLDFSLRIKGSGTAPIFVNRSLRQLPCPADLTTASFQDSGLTSSDSLSLSIFLSAHPNLTQWLTSARTG
jgi:hypothetical protein